MNALKQRLLAGEFISAAWAEMGSADNAEVMVYNGWPVIVIDGEHGIGDLETWVGMSRAIEAAGGHAVLRVPNSQPWMLNKILDRGIRSIIVPRVNTPEEAQIIADACRYPPRGNRGYAAPILRASNYSARPDYALKEAHDDVLVMVQCEHVQAVENIAAIASIDGIDAIFIGPNDLAGSVNHLERLTEAEPQALIQRAEEGCLAKGKLLATIAGAGRSWADLKEIGYRFVVGPNDVSLLINGARQAAAERDQSLGTEAAPLKKPGASYGW
ncbi:HpcH/HpaI aldolase family protein [Rhizobium sp. NRK18]|uniref:HpcH/HpaI aldolase family protein n=1 Tax=Rhizobium sp. NRK18 TaxID=2964667 RepID=UPI0021C41C2A|nr:aldolase/citrate lyase family protein [Rhizobium sp. NRK18]MCQ2002584.1 aldolase/citrate lyase family protein [Rhizobium sp. NRK18]